MKKSSLSITLSILLLLFALTACGGEKTPPVNAGETDPQNTTEQTNGGSAAEGEGWVLHFDTRDLAGEKVTQADFAEHTLTVLNVWATWCGPCVAEIPELQEVSEIFADRGVKIVGVLIDGTDEAGNPDEEMIAELRQSLSELGIDYLMILPDEALYTWLVAPTQSIPMTYFVDSNGEVVHSVLGKQDAKQWSKTIEQVLGELS